MLGITFSISKRHFGMFGSGLNKCFRTLSACLPRRSSAGAVSAIPCCFASRGLLGAISVPGKPISHWQVKRIRRDRYISGCTCLLLIRITFCGPENKNWKASKSDMVHLLDSPKGETVEAKRVPCQSRVD